MSSTSRISAKLLERQLEGGRMMCSQEMSRRTFKGRSNLDEKHAR